VLFWV